MRKAKNMVPTAQVLTLFVLVFSLGSTMGGTVFSLE